MKFKPENWIPVALGVSFIAVLLFVKKKRHEILTKDGVGIAKYLIKKGYSKANASGIAGNLYVESTYNPLAIGDNGQSFGLAQWHKDRWDKLIKYASDRKVNHKTFQVQLDYLDWELNNTEKKAMDKLRESKNAYDSAYNFAKYFERPLVISPTRMITAEEIYKMV